MEDVSGYREAVRSLEHHLFQLMLLELATLAAVIALFVVSLLS